MKSNLNAVNLSSLMRVIGVHNSVLNQGHVVIKSLVLICVLKMQNVPLAKLKFLQLWIVVINTKFNVTKRI